MHLDVYQVFPELAERTLPVAPAVALRCARLRVPAPSRQPDAHIAATSLVHGMTGVRRNVAEFERTSVRLLKPSIAVET